VETAVLDLSRAAGSVGTDRGSCAHRDRSALGRFEFFRQDTGQGGEPLLVHLRLRDGCAWGVQALAATITGDIPQSVSDSGHPTGVVFVLDLGLVVPLFFIGANLLRRRQPWGFLLGGILLVKGVAEGLALLGMSLFMYLDDYPDIDVALIRCGRWWRPRVSLLRFRSFVRCTQPRR
jgi:hypothetical protein